MIAKNIKEGVYELPTKTINILKASLPFVPSQMQRGLSYYIKIEEFNEMVQHFQEDAKSTLSACSISEGEERSFNINEYLAAISPYLNKNERDMIQMITNVVQAMKLYNITKEFSWDMADVQPFPATPAPIPPQEKSQTEPQWQTSPDPNRFNTESNGFNVEPNTFNIESNSFNIETVKNMLSPSQRAMFDTYSAMLNQQT